MKRILMIVLCLTLVACMLFAMTGCGTKEDAETTSTEATTIEDTTYEDILDTTEAEIVTEPTNAKPDGVKTIAETMAEAFTKYAKNDSDAEAVANKLTKVEGIPVQLAMMEIEGDYVNGFSAPVAGYNSIYMVSPVIGTIPFTCYVIDTDDTKVFVKTNEPNIDLNYNICTTADEYKIVTEGNLVFVVLAPYTIEG